MTENNNLDGWQEEFLNYEANPVDNRTLEQFYDDTGVSQSTVHRWRRDNQDLINREVERRRKSYTSSLRSIAYKSLSAKMKSKDTNAIKLFFQLVGDLVERSETKSQVEYMTPEQKREKVLELLNKISPKENKSDDTGHQAGSPTS